MLHMPNATGLEEIAGGSQCQELSVSKELASNFKANQLWSHKKLFFYTILNKWKRQSVRRGYTLNFLTVCVEPRRRVSG